MIATDPTKFIMVFSFFSLAADRLNVLLMGYLFEDSFSWFLFNLAVNKFPFPVSSACKLIYIMTMIEFVASGFIIASYIAIRLWPVLVHYPI